MKNKISLSDVAKNLWFSEQKEKLKTVVFSGEHNGYDKAYAQITFIPEKSFSVKYMVEGKVVERYSDLPDLKLQLTEDDTKIFASKSAELKKNPLFHDGNHILIKDVLLDDNVVYLEAYRATYALLRCLQLQCVKPFDFGSTVLWRHGVMSPFITEDKHTVLLERSADKFYSVAAGFIQPQHLEAQINFRDDEQDLVVRQGLQESDEEFLFDPDTKRRLDVLPGMRNVAISMRQMNNATPVLEFISPIHLKCGISDLLQVLNDNASSA